MGENIERANKKLGLTLKYHDVDRIDAAMEHFERITNEKGNGWMRPLTPEENAFINNERILCRLDFKYFFSSYIKIKLKGTVAKIGRPTLWDSQKILLQRMADREEANFEIFKQYKGKAPIDGIKLVIHKARQLGYTAFCRTVMAHRQLFYPGSMGMAASVDEDKLHELYDRDHLIYNSIPWWLRPAIKFDVKDEHVQYDGGSNTYYQQSLQKTGIGTGRSFDSAHLTECAFFENAWRIEFDFFPTVPQSINSIVLLESTGNGRGGWWYDLVKRIEGGSMTGWDLAFIPWYTESTLNRRLPPEGWEPNRETIAHAEVVERTSEHYVGKKVELDKQQLYWYESEMQNYVDMGTLAIFLTNYCATIEESFQNTGRGAFPIEVLRRCSLNVKTGVPFDLIWVNGQLRLAKATDITKPLDVIGPQEALGVVWLFEAPDPTATYVVGVDPTMGITGWNRQTKQVQTGGFQGGDLSEEDKKPVLETDNACVSVWKIGKNGDPDIQVAEFTAPNDPYEIAPVVNLLGRMYKGNSELECAHVIIEVLPGPGWQIERTLIDKYGYTNFYVWKYQNTFIPTPTNYLGWQASPKTVRDLWVLCSRHITLGLAVTRSPWLIDEMANCRMDEILMSDTQKHNSVAARAASGFHDDRVRAAMLAMWAAHDFSAQVEFTQAFEQKKPEVKRADWQSTDISYEEMLHLWEEQVDKLSSP